MESQTTSSRPNASSRSGTTRTRVPFLGFIPDRPRKHFLAMLSEFVGTVLFLFFLERCWGDTNIEGTYSNTSQLLFIALSFGFSLAVTAWVFFRVSGSLFNPVAAALCSCLYPGPLTTETLLGGGTSISRGLFIEMFMTALLILTVLMLAAEKHKSTFLAPVGIGLSLFVGMMASVHYTGGSLNPARSFGPAVVNHSFPHYHWIYWVGPILGSLLATGFYELMKVFEYESVNPDQDKTVTEMKRARNGDFEAGVV